MSEAQKDTHKVVSTGNVGRGIKMEGRKGVAGKK